MTPKSLPADDRLERSARTATAAPSPADTELPGLTTAEAHRRLTEVGPNSLPDTTVHPVTRALRKFWAPVPWMLEAAIVLELVLGNTTGAAVIAGLLLFNAGIGLYQEGKAQATLAALKSRLALNASVCRDENWTIIASADVVPGDLVKLSLGAVVPADVDILTGSLLLDESSLTGESEPVERGAGTHTFAGALVQRGTADARVTDTGPRTKFGNSAELVRTAHVESSQQKVVLRVVRNIALFNGVVTVALVAYAITLGWTFGMTAPLVLTAILAAIPVALPATFTLAAALGARLLAKVGVLPTRLSAIDEAASVDVLCVDKTGTLTKNQLSVDTVAPMAGYDESHVITCAVLASDQGGQDPVDAAIRTRSERHRMARPPTLQRFTPFDPANRISEALVTTDDGRQVRIVKGAFDTVIALCTPSNPAAAALGTLEDRGLRVLAVAEGPTEARLTVIGLVALSDPPRADSAALISELAGMGVRMVMVTGDAAATAGNVARAVGLDGNVCPPGPLPANVRPEQFAVFAGVFPEGKYDLVKGFQKSGHTVGMCGDGANDAPALRQAQMGVAVSTATDVAKSAAGIVLTTAGLGGIVAAVTAGRLTYQRVLTYTLNSLTKKVTNVLFLALGLVITGHAILTPMLMVIIMITGDFLGMSVTTDNVRPSAAPSVWKIGDLTKAGVVMGSCMLAFCTGSLLIGKYCFGLGIGQLQTLSAVTLIFGGEAIYYCVRERRHLWKSRPSRWMIVATVADLVIISLLAVGGIEMQALPAAVVAGSFAAAALFGFLVDFVKVPTFRRLEIF
ncbi:HAD-IC family P-type ATPase [Mycolicibacterium komossense]|uniref:HAD-IC family P-type ATPase n=1 Tax=Mycolicibacterium komossense TaxID=1779 RepID=A0ABT3CJ99_9MYCO|nr:HAD-IC family P-type ATPase [Mycolicibacterium komossense]MCV7229573.1 HAD-IC family P-type ATPase [Mycolicibacterium komossense]